MFPNRGRSPVVAGAAILVKARRWCPKMGEFFNLGCAGPGIELSAVWLGVGASVVPITAAEAAVLRSASMSIASIASIAATRPWSSP